MAPHASLQGLRHVQVLPVTHAWSDQKRGCEARGQGLTDILSQIFAVRFRISFLLAFRF